MPAVAQPDDEGLLAGPCRWPSSTAARTTPRRRWNGTAAFYLWEAALKLLGSAAVVEYADGRPRAQLAERLQNLARPRWPLVGVRPPAGPRAGRRGRRGFRRSATWSWAAPATTCPAPPAWTPPCVERSRARRRRRSHGPPDRAVRPPGAATATSEIGHGAAGQRPGGSTTAWAAPCWRAWPRSGRLDVLAGRRLIYVGDVRRQPRATGWSSATS